VLKSIQGSVWEKTFSRKGAKAQRKLLRNAAALCAFAGEIFFRIRLFVQSRARLPGNIPGPGGKNIAYPGVAP
jgi:hypothetical protein